MRTLPLLVALVVAPCVRSPVSPPAPREYDESIKFPKALDSGGTLVSRLNQSFEIDGVAFQAIAIAARDFIPSESEGLTCWNKPEDYRFQVIRQESITFVEISPDYFACEHGPAPLDFGAKYAISTDGRILRRLFAGEPDWTSDSESSDAGASESPAESRKYELRDLEYVLKEQAEQVADPPFFTRPEWLDGGNNPWNRVPRPRPPSASVPDGGAPDGGSLDGGSPAPPPR